MPLYRRRRAYRAALKEVTVDFKSTVDDPAWFKSSPTVVAHFGLTPKRYQSGEMDNPGHVS